MKKNNGRLFHTGLFLESLRQMRMMGLVYLMLCAIFAILPPILSGYGEFYPIAASEHAMVLYIYDFVAPLTTGYALFGYLTRRNASDFYHAMPVTREAAYLSRAAAAAVYQLITIAVTVVASYLSFMLMGCPVNPLQIPLLISYHFAASMLVLGCTLLGLAAAGTYFSSFVVAGVVLFLPQMILFILYTMIDATAPTVYPETLSFLLDIPMNIPAGLIAGVFSGGFGLNRDPLSYVLYFPSHLYTLLLAVLVLGIGCVIHNRRRSETARSAAPNRFLQHLYRSLIALPFFLLIGTMIATNESLGADFESYVILTVLGLLVYFLYELVTTRKWRNLLSAAKVLPLVLIVALALPWLGFGIGHAVDDNVPEREKIESVTLDVDQVHSSDPNYEMIALSRYEYTDDEMIAVLHEALEMTVAYHQHYGNGYGVVMAVPLEEAMITESTTANVYENTGYRTMDVQYNLKGGKTMVRNIRLTPDQYNEVCSLQLKDEGFCDILGELPETEQIVGLRAAGHTVPSRYSDITRDEIWNTFCEEYAALEPEVQMALNSFNDRVDYAYSVPIAMDYKSAIYIAENEFGYHYYDSGNTLQVVGFDGLRSFNSQYKVTSLTPKTLMLMMQYINDMAAEYSTTMPELADNLGRIQPEDSVNFYMTLRIYDPEYRYAGAMDLSRSILSEEQMADPEMAEEIARDMAYSIYPNYVGHEYLDAIDKVLEILMRGSTQIDSLDSPIVLMEHVSWDSYKYYNGYAMSPMFFKLNDADFMELMELMEPYWAVE